MKKIIALASLAALIAGCSNEPAPTEAEIFGYKGRDLQDQEDRMFFSTGPGVTNWVPTRVLSVSEHYEFTSNELALVAAAGVIIPSSALDELPKGYSEKAREPWFTTWVRDVEAFGKKGSGGFISHYNDAKKKFETGEPYFSTYYDSEAAALTALAELEVEVAKFAPKKFHRFDKCWVAEYVRLRVMGLCGQRPDGTWTCMLSVNDKCELGCGSWEPVEAQQARVDEIAYKAEVKAWHELVDKKAQENHVAVLAAAKSAELPLFGEDVQPQATGDGRMVYVRTGAFPMSNVVQKVIWDEKAGELRKAVAVRLGAPEVRDYGPYEIWGAEITNRLFTVRLDMAFPKPSTNTEERVDAPGEWRQLCFENILPGFEPPPAPQRRK